MLIKIIFVLSSIIFFALFFVTAPYGRHVASRMNIGRNNRLLSTRKGWLIMEIPSILIFLLCWGISDVGLKGLLQGTIHITTFLYFFIFFFIWNFHYVYRTFIATFLVKEAQGKFRYYVVIMGAVFTTINGFINGWWLFIYMPTHVLQGNFQNIIHYIYSIPFLIGTLVFGLGFIIHVTNDAILRELKQKNNGAYVIPNKYLHKYIASPNYLGEIIQWMGWAILTQSLAGWSFAVFTFANLVPRAFANHRWYRRTFKDYPTDRKILIPFLI